MTIQRSAWKDAAWIFVLSRLTIVFISFLGTIALPLAGQPRTPLCASTPQACLLSWLRWDAMVYVDIARNGYTLARNTVFFPLWPLLMHSVGFAFGDPITVYYIVGMVLANLLFYLALVLFHALLNADYDGTTARNALFYLAFSPYALFLGWKRLPLHYSLFALIMMLFSLSYSHNSTEPLIGAPRYMLVIFPIIVICALWARNPRFDRVFQALSLPTFALNIVLFVNHYWVA